MDVGRCVLTHADDGSLVVHNDTLALQRVSALANNSGNLLIKWVGEANVSDNTALEESEWTDALGAVDNLVWDDEVSWLNLLPEGTDSGECNDAADADGAESGNVGTVWNLMWCDGVVGSVTGDEGDDGLLVLEDGDWGGWYAPWCGNFQAGDWRETVEFLETGAANDGDVDWAWMKVSICGAAAFLLLQVAYRRRRWLEVQTFLVCMLAMVIENNKTLLKKIQSRENNKTGTHLN